MQPAVHILKFASEYCGNMLGLDTNSFEVSVRVYLDQMHISDWIPPVLRVSIFNY